MRKDFAGAWALACCALMLSGCDADAPWSGPKTAAEASNYERTSTSDEVRAFVAACAAHAPTLRVEEIGRATRDRPIDVVLAADPPVASVAAAGADPRLKVLVMANIHAGEVEGKEAVLVLLREIAQGRHRDILAKLVVAIIPNYNPDGNDEVDRKHRPDQAGPLQGVGTRHNAMNLDLNRDYVKVAAPETSALLTAVRALDAAIVVDCHTTNGSYHGYDLTYAGPLHPATDPKILDYVRVSFLPDLQARMRRRGFETFDYGNWVQDGVPASGWTSFEGLPRYGNSYFGLANRLTLLSEAYSHEPFEKRIRATYALVTEALAILAGEADRVRAILAGARRDAAALASTGRLPTGTQIARTIDRHPVLVGSIRAEKDPVTGLVREWDTDVAAPVEMPVFAWFSGKEERPVRAGWIVAAPDEKLLRALRLHGIEATILDRDRDAKLEIFAVSYVETASRPFQGHKLTTLRGACHPRDEQVPKGSLYVSARQPLARLAFVLLEPESEDGLATWGLLPVVDDAAGGRRFAVSRLVSWTGR